MGDGGDVSTVWRLLADDGASASGGLALDEALMASYARGAPFRPPTIRLYTYAGPCALVGRYQDVRAEVDLEACERTATSVNRRPTGGGAIVMGPGQLGVAVVGRAPASERPRQTLERLAAGIVRGLAELDIHASFRGKNDLECGGRKIAGLGLYLDGRGAMLFHSSVLADLDVGAMLEVLRIPAAKLGDKAAAAVAERVTTVSRERGEPWTGAGLRDAVAIGFEKEFGVRLVADEPSAAEADAATELERTRYLDPAWVFQRSPGRDARGSAVMKTPAGLVRVALALERGAIKSVLFTGDFNELPRQLARLESALRWTRLERAPSIVARECGEGTGLGIGPDVLAGALAEAGARAAARDGGATPDRQGSCYFPGGMGGQSE